MCVAALFNTETREMRIVQCLPSKQNEWNTSHGPYSCADTGDDVGRHSLSSLCNPLDEEDAEVEEVPNANELEPDREIV
jgi:hypothetical protein